MATQIVCKILYNEETRRITLNRLSYSDLLGKLREVGIPEEALLRVVYTDQDEDNITVASDADLADALSFSSTGSLRLKLLPSATRLFESNTNTSSNTPAAAPAFNPLDSSTVLRMLSNVDATGDFTALLGNLATLLPPGSGVPSESLIADLQAAAAAAGNNNEVAPEEEEQEEQEEVSIPVIPSLTPDASLILRLLSNADSSAQFASLLGDVGAFLPSSAVPSESPAPSEAPVNFTELIAALGPVLQELGPQIAALGPQIEALGPQLAALGPQLAALTPMLNNLADRVGPQLNALGAQVAPQVEDIVTQVTVGLNALGEQVEPQIRALGEQVIPQLEEIGTQAFQSLASDALLSSFAEPPAQAPQHVENSQDVRAILAALSLNEETIQNILQNAGNDPETAIALANALTNN